jgi:uncharacterized protein (DUF1800 family)
MGISRRSFLQGSGAAAFGLSLGTGIRWVGATPARSVEANPLIHVLNRVTWGVRPEDIVKISEMGLEGYIDWQLTPDQIDDPLIEAFEDEWPVVTASYADLTRMSQDDYGYVLKSALWNRVYRAIYSERQLYELVVEFWTDHFNIAIDSSLVGKIWDDRVVIRRHALGKFRDLLLASAQSPAMLVYLDNVYSNKDHPNENYARELMELHTLGVDGGYTEQDVKEVARVLTGWQVPDGPEDSFFFKAEDHDVEAKTILGKSFPAGRGIEEGLQLIDLLANHPSTARFISTKLCRRFVSDVPPASLVESAANVFLSTDGDIRAVLRHILLAPEFMASQWQKFRRPLEYMVALLRVMRPGLTIKDEDAFVWMLEPMGHLPYYWGPPNGYPDLTDAWLNTNGLLHRWNLAMNLPLASLGYWDGARFNINKTIPQKDTIGELVDAVTAVTIGANIAPQDREQLISVVSSGLGDGPVTRDLRQDKLPTLLGLLLASPYFQWR